MGDAAPSTYSVTARNLSLASENRIHDDAVARRYGFAGGLVPGVEVYAYACHPVVSRWGLDWLSRGTAGFRLLKPVYDGEVATALAGPAGAGLAIRVESRGERCLEGEAGLSDTGTTPPDARDWPDRPPPAERPPADQASLARGTALAIRPFLLTADLIAAYVADIGETDPLYVREGLAHPGALLRLCNLLLRENVLMPPWIHVGSRVASFAPARAGEVLSARALVTDEYERKGHRFVDLDAAILADSRVIARVAHIAIYRPRQTVEG